MNIIMIRKMCARFIKASFVVAVLSGAYGISGALADEMDVAASQAEAPVSINSADAQTLAETLDGVGESKAAAIVEWREQHGDFTAVDELTQVRGIGQATVDKNRHKLSL